MPGLQKYSKYSWLTTTLEKSYEVLPAGACDGSWNILLAPEYGHCEMRSIGEGVGTTFGAEELPCLSLVDAI